MAGIPMDIAQKRSLLFTARMRFSASGADVRKQAIQKIIEQNLASSGNQFFNIDEIREVLDFRGIFTVLRDADVREGIERLQESGRLEEEIAFDEPKYRLSEEAYDENIRLIEESDRKFAQVLHSLFGQAQGGAERYKRAFIRLLCTLFAKLGQVYVQIILGDIKPDDFIDQKAFVDILDNVIKEENVIDIEAFKYGVAQFFRDSSPMFTAIKWNMAQNYYVAKSLGADEGGNLLSAQMLNGATFYLDTNVLLAGLIPEDRHHGSFNQLVNACKKFNIALFVAHITRQELIYKIVDEAKLVREVIGKIPEETRQKIDSVLLEPFFNARAKDKDLTFDKWFEQFLKLAEALDTKLKLQVDDDAWFEKEADSQVTQKMARQLISLFINLRKRPKSGPAAQHDALLLRWIDHKISQEQSENWLITLDTTLPLYSKNPANGLNAKVLTLDALLQWIAPHLLEKEEEDGDMAEVYSEALRYQLLPRGVFFDVADFKVFANMDIETGELPAEDVEACIRYLKKAVPDFDLTKAEDREKIDKEVRKFFTDDGRKYRKELSRLEGMVREKDDKLAKAEQTIGELQNEIKTIQDDSRDKDQNIEKIRAQVQEFQEELTTRDKQEEIHKLKNSIILRSIPLLILLIALEIGASLISWKYGDGNNFFLKCKSLWEFHLFGFAFPSLLFPLVMGRKRMRLLKWWKGEDVDPTE